MTPNSLLDTEIEYPSSDGEPLAESTKQYRWIVTMESNLEKLTEGQNIFVGADNFIYPVKGKPKINQAPDVYAAIGRPKGHRGSYKVWAEDDIFPQFIVEVWSPTNTLKDMLEKRAFYEKYGCLEYIEIEPETETLAVWMRELDRLEPITIEHEWISPLLGVRFVQEWQQLNVYLPNGERFLTDEERRHLEAEREETIRRAQRQIAYQRQQTEAAEARAEAEKRRVEAAKRKAQAEKQRAEAEKQRAEAEKQRAEAEKQRADDSDARALAEQQLREQLAAKLRELGVDPDTIE